MAYINKKTYLKTFTTLCKNMNRVLRNTIRKYHVPHNGIGKSFPREETIFGDVQEHLSQQLKFKKMVITIHNPIYVSKESTEHPTPYSVDLHYGYNRYVYSVDGNNCEELVRDSIEWIINTQPV